MHSIQVMQMIQEIKVMLVIQEVGHKSNASNAIKASDASDTSKPRGYFKNERNIFSGGKEKGNKKLPSGPEVPLVA